MRHKEVGNTKKIWHYIYKRYLLDALSAMGQGLFASLIIGLILSQLGRIPGLGFLSQFTADAFISGKATPVVGAAIGVAIAYGLKVHPLCMFACAAAGAIGYTQGGPVGAYLAAVFASEAGGRVAGKTRVDIIVIPAATIIVGGLVSMICAPGINRVMAALREFIDWATLLSPIPMGIIVSVVVGLALTAPISSAALCAMIFTVPEGETAGLGLMLAAGAATAGCCAQMVGFAVTSFRENGWGGLISQGLGTSMIQISNILKRPAILLPPTLASAITGPLCTTLFQMKNLGSAAGMGTSGLVGQIGTWAVMSAETPAVTLIVNMALTQLILPAVLSLVFYWALRRMGWIREGDMKLPEYRK